jgi:alkanesulfonate monooxygenase SsuD/methylene tetrahydromethanopterin reductase-like flavin-dependent oxidoreductase (luciferase family)
MLCYVSAHQAEVDAVIDKFLAPAMNRPAAELRQRLLLGSVDQCIEKLQAYAAAGAQRVFIWPIIDDPRQLQIVASQIMPALASPARP